MKNLRKTILWAVFILTTTYSFADTTENYNLAQEFYAQKEYQKAYDLYKKISDNGHAEAQYHVGMMNREQKIPNANNETAIKYFIMAADNGHAKAQDIEGVAYIYGDYVSKDLKKAYKYFTLSAQQGSTMGLHSLAHIYYGSFDGDFKTDMKKAITLFQQAVDAGDVYSAYDLSEIYMEGSGVKQDKKRAFELMKFVVDTDSSNKEALAKLGIYYIEASGVQKNIKKGEKYIAKAAELGNILASDYLAAAYDGGIFGKDIEKALYYYKKSAQSGRASSQFSYGLRMMEIEIAKEKRNEKNLLNAHMWISLALKKGYNVTNIELLEYFVNLPKQFRHQIEDMAEECIKKQYQCD